MKVKSLSRATLRDPMDYSQPGSSVKGLSTFNPSQASSGGNNSSRLPVGVNKQDLFSKTKTCIKNLSLIFKKSLHFMEMFISLCKTSCQG